MRKLGIEWIRDRPAVVFALGTILLFAQFWYASTVEEFYPAILLPGGAGFVRDDAAFSTNRWLLFAVRRDDVRVHLDENALLSTLPAQSRPPLMALSFGLSSESSTTPEEGDEARAWLRKRVHQQLGRDDIAAIDIVFARYTPSKTRGPEPYVALRVRRVPIE